MNDRGTIFRKVSLDRLSSPEQLDLLVPVVTPRAWLGVLPLVAFVLGGVAWGIFGSVPTLVSGRAILLQQGGLAEISAPAEGRIAELLVGVGDVVEAGQPVARISQPGLVEKQRQASQRLDELRREEDRLQTLLGQSGKLNRLDLDNQRANLVERLRASDERASQLREKVATQETLLGQGLITRQALLGTRGELTGVLLEADALRNQVQQLALRQLESDKQVQAELSQIHGRVSEARRELEGIEQSARLSSIVESSRAGRVVEMRVAKGVLVAPGTPLLNIESKGGGGDLDVAIYVAAADGKKVQPGMPVQVSPTTVKREEYGFMLGEVTFVATYPASQESMRVTLQNDALVSELIGRTTPIEIRAKLLPGIGPGSYRWSSSQTPPVKVTAGTQAVASIEIRQQPPISLVIPALRRLFGVI